MPGPAATLLRPALLERASRTPLAPPPRPGRGPVPVVAAAAGVVLLPALLVVGIFVGAQPAPGCGSAPAIPGSWSGPGSLGGVDGTGVSSAELAAARRIPGLGGTKLTPGTYSPTAYLPNSNAPATNCGSTCSGTASGIKVDNATKRAYLIASNPRSNQYGALAYIWPNPYGWTGPFVVADTGSAFTGVGRLDFYIFIDTGQTWQQALAKAYQWGPADQVTVSATPIQPGGPSITQPIGQLNLGGSSPTAPPASTPAPAAGGCTAAPLDPTLSGRIAQIAARYIGDGPSIPGFQPPNTSLEWCAWFASNVWRLAGVGIPVTFASEDLYTWARAHHTLWMAVGQAPPGATPPLGSALEYGSGPSSTSTSLHVNLVTRVNTDGSFMLTGGNEAGAQVDLDGPCRLTGTAGAVHLTGPGCDTRQVYGIAAPGALT
jgi:3D (Asp-Asp-Asp) domain-containing protein